jgi:formylglycine-generating enzyme required for sulfatase activity/chitodextrinase
LVICRNIGCIMRLFTKVTIASVISIQISFATTINVPADQPTIQAGIDASVDGDTVLVQPGTYFENIIWPAINGIKLIGSSEFNCFIDGSQTSSVIRFEDDLSGIIDATTLITEFTVQNGDADSGGGIYCYDASPSLTSLTITDNSAVDGGGIFCMGSSPCLMNVSVNSNASSDGGGIYFNQGSVANLVNVTISGNTAVSFGGGVYCRSFPGISPIFENTSIIDNMASDGGGVYCEEGNPTFIDVTISGNSAENHGGGVRIFLADPNLVCVLISANSAHYGGGIYCDSGANLGLEDVTITTNMALQGGGVYIFEASMNLESSILWNNSPQEIYLQTNFELPSSITTACSDIEGGETGIVIDDSCTVYWLDGNFDLNPLFCDPVNGDYKLHAESPCLPGNHPDDYDCGLIGALGHGCGAVSEPIFTEDFNHSGSMAPEWTIESHTPLRSTPWAPVHDSGEDWSVISSQTQFQEPFDEWLISPVYDLANYVDLELTFWHDYQHDGSEAKVKYSTNGGASWELLTTYTSTASGTESFDISAWSDEQANVRFLFVFSGEFLSNASWNIDDFQLSGVMSFDDTAPTTSDPIPLQPMNGQWSGLTGTVGCTFTDPSGVSASTLQVRIDANGDGGYDDGGAEDWTDITGFDDGNEVPINTEVSFLEGMEGMAFEFRAKDLSETNDLYGYSGYGNAEGIEDDWSVNIFYEADPPVFSNPIPIGQPEPAWTDNRTVSVGCTVTDSSAVNASSLHMRVDWNQSGSYDDPGEEWTPLTGYTTSSEIVVFEDIEFPADGLFNIEFQASDTLGNDPGYSMIEEGISDDIFVRIDTTPPTASYLYLQGTGNNSATLLFSPTSDLTFVRYEIYSSLDSLVDESDALWTDADDTALGEITTSTTTVTGLNFGTPYWFRTRAVDEAGHEGDWSNTVHSLTEGIPLAAITDLSIEVVENSLLLTWSEPTEDENGNIPVFIEGYDVHTSTDPHFVPTTETKIATVVSNSFLHEIELSGGVVSFYRVVALGCGNNTTSLIHVPSGVFVMGSNEIGGYAAPEHEVTLTNDFFLGDFPITNQQYLEAVQWAYDQGLVTATIISVSAYGQQLLNLGSGFSEISFSNDTFSLQMLLWDGGYWGPGNAYPEGYDPANHPVKEITWYGAVCYCDWLSMIEGLEPFYQGVWDQTAEHNPYNAEGYRLPTEAEWEYAARYNDDRIFPWGNEEPDCFNANFAFDYPEGLCIGWTTPRFSHPDGVSELGLNDMAGNVWDWVGDWWGDYSSDSQVDPLGPSYASNNGRSKRGGSFYYSSEYSRTVTRSNDLPYGTHYSIGFRIARTANP